MKKLFKSVACLLASAFAVGATACGADNGNETETQHAYSVTLGAQTNGTLVSSAKTVGLGGAVTFTATPAAGYVLDELIINGTAVDVSLVNGSYVYTVYNVVRDYTASVSFVKPDVTVRFSVTDYEAEVPAQSAVYGQAFGTLPAPVAAGARFVGWLDEKGNAVTENTVVSKTGEITLYADFEPLTEADLAGLIPFTVTTSFYDGGAKDCGVVWHTAVEPIAPVVKWSTSAEFTDEQTAACTYDDFLGEYTIKGALTGLDYDTTYFVRFGDAAADVWGKTYSFQTRKESVEKTGFVYLGDTAQEYKAANMGADAATGNTYWHYVMKDATARFGDVAFTAHGGNFVEHTFRADYWNEMLSSVEKYAFAIPTVAGSGYKDSYIRYSLREGITEKLFNVKSVSENNYLGQYYSFDYGALHFVTLRTNDIYAEYNVRPTASPAYELGNDQLAWLKSDVETAKANGAKWIVVMMNEGLMEGKDEIYQTHLRAQLAPVFDELCVDLVLGGNAGYLASTYPLAYRDGEFTATATARSASYDGVSVNEFDYTSNGRGTVYYQTGPVGPNYATFEAVPANYLTLLSGARGVIDAGVAYSTYSYIEVTENSLVLRTYGVNVKGMSETISLDATSCGKYLDGVRLTK